MLDDLLVGGRRFDQLRDVADDRVAVAHGGHPDPRPLVLVQAQELLDEGDRRAFQVGGIELTEQLREGPDGILRRPSEGLEEASVAVAGDVRLRLFPEIVGRHREPESEEIQAAVNLDEPGLADQVRQDAP